MVFEGACDASGAVPLDARFFAVADDEDNTLRVYDAELGGPPIRTRDVSAPIALSPKAKKPKRVSKKKSKPPKAREADLEAATRLGDAAIWMSSHARSKSGKRQPDRLRYFVTDVPEGEAPIEVIGDVYRGLLDDLVASSTLARFDLATAAELAPQAPGGLNIEGLTAAPEGHVLIGFRNPIPGGRALVVPILNPTELSTATPARFGEPALVDLGGRGVRALSWWRGRYLVVGGAFDDETDARLYAWTSSTVRELDVDLRDFNPEATFTPDERDEILLLSDDGARSIGGGRCKDLKDPAKRRFRGVWVRM